MELVERSDGLHFGLEQEQIELVSFAVETTRRPRMPAPVLLLFG